MTIKLRRSQMETLRLTAAGYSAREIADQYGISRPAVERSRKLIRRRLDVASNVELMVRAIHLGLIDPNEAIGDQMRRRQLAQIKAARESRSKPR